MRPLSELLEWCRLKKRTRVHFKIGKKPTLREISLVRNGNSRVSVAKREARRKPERVRTFDEFSFSVRNAAKFVINYVLIFFSDGSPLHGFGFPTAGCGRRPGVFTIRPSPALSSQFPSCLQDVRVMPDSIKQLPMQLNDTVIYYENELLIVESERGLSLICNMNFQYCTFHVSGTRFIINIILS